MTVGNEARALALCVVGVPVAAFLAARLGGSTSPESRHLIFVLPFFAILVGAGIVRATRRLPAAAFVLTVVLVILEVSWAWHRTPQLFEWEPNKRQATRAQAESFLAATSRPDDLLFGYEPLFLGAWERNNSFPDVVVPRADAVLALKTLQRQPKPLGRGVWILDASEHNNLKPRLEMENRDPGPPGIFETACYGPFLDPPDAGAREDGGRLPGSGGTGDAGRPLARDRRRRFNMQTIELADRSLRGYGPSLRLRSDTSR